jgi:ArsR family transcriptional regulator, lead/cadmium/zinc/bismuth-responsive transcriptional repressor
MTNHGELLHLDEREGQALRRAKPNTEAAERMAGRFGALSDPTRLGLALALRDGRELCVCDLSWIAERPQNLTSHHLKVLRTQGIVAARRDGKMTMYRLTPGGRRLLGAALAHPHDAT